MKLCSSFNNYVGGDTYSLNTKAPYLFNISINQWPNTYNVFYIFVNVDHVIYYMVQHQIYISYNLNCIKYLVQQQLHGYLRSCKTL